MDIFLTKVVPDIQRLVDTGRTAEAIYALEEVAPWILANLAFAWNGKELHRLDKAEEYLKIAVKVAPAMWEMRVNLAHVLNLNNKWEEAKAEASKGVELSGGSTYEPYYNLGVICANLGQQEEAIGCYRKAMELKKNEPNLASYNISASLLLMKQWKEGWANYDNRFTAFEKIRLIRDRFKTIYSLKCATKGKKIYVFSEQGIGDLFQFVRYLPKLTKTGAKVIVEAQEAAAKLIKDNFKVEVVPRSDGVWPEVPEIDYALSVCSLPGIFEAGIKPIPNKPYLVAPIRELPDILKAAKLKVGICWAGSPDHTNDSKRSARLAEFVPLLKVANVQFFSLQKKTAMVRKWGGRYVDLLAGVPQTDIVDLSVYFNDFSDTAYYISQMDLIITVDTSIAHLAGAMGKSVWILIDKHHDWRWGLEGATTSWYPSMQIFRQSVFGEWSSVFAEVATQLTSYQIQHLGQTESVVCGKKGSKKLRCQKRSQ